MTATYQQPSADRCVRSMKRSGKLGIALLGILLGVLLLFLGNRAGKSTAPQAPASSPATKIPTAEEYRAGLESRMETICAEIAGVGTVDVAVTLEGDFETVYATDKKITAGGESTTYVTVGSGDGETLIYVTTRPPAIIGIGVVCAGGSDPQVQREVTALLSAAFGVGSNKIYVTTHK